MIIQSTIFKGDISDISAKTVTLVRNGVVVSFKIFHVPWHGDVGNSAVVSNKLLQIGSEQNGKEPRINCDTYLDMWTVGSWRDVQQVEYFELQ